MNRYRLALIALLFATMLTPLGLVLADTPADNPNRALWNTAASANTDIFSVEARPEASTPSVAYRLTIGLVSTNSIVNVAITGGSSPSTVGFDLNDGTALTAGRLYTFTFGGERSDSSGNALTYNVQCETATTVGFASLQEVRIP